MTPSNFKAASAYRTVGLETRAASHDQHQLVIMMYETVLESMAVARGAIAAGDTPLKLKHIDKALRIIQEGLRTSLDLEHGGELAQNLADLYDYAVVRLAQANAGNDAGILQEVSELIKPLVEAWKQIRPGATEATTTPAANTPSVDSAPRNNTQRSASRLNAYATPMFAGA